MLHSGIAPLPEWMIGDLLRDGSLVRVLPEYEWPEQGAYAVFPNTQHVSTKVRSFIDFFRDFQPPGKGI